LLRKFSIEEEYFCIAKKVSLASYTPQFKTHLSENINKQPNKKQHLRKSKMNIYSKKMQFKIEIIIEQTIKVMKFTPKQKQKSII